MDQWWDKYNIQPYTYWEHKWVILLSVGLPLDMDMGWDIAEQSASKWT